MKITKRNGSIVLFDDEKVKNSILKANACVAGETLSAKKAGAIANEAFDSLMKEREMVMTAEVRAYIYALLKEKGYPKTAEAYWTYKKEK